MSSRASGLKCSHLALIPAVLIIPLQTSVWDFEQTGKHFRNHEVHSSSRAPSGGCTCLGVAGSILHPRSHASRMSARLTTHDERLTCFAGADITDILLYLEGFDRLIGRDPFWQQPRSPPLTPPDRTFRRP
ncbi:uncharacterized protein LOC113565653 [Drosophila persimilis]|uniref:uncharacterized protein LOC113565653 n=1 Tax=Drosophila persimilis TaxID=7234 RepID=UPI000F07D9F8|nr:uncharacterized protein LOC113565653 [Drosophila persimilis]